MNLKKPLITACVCAAGFVILGGCQASVAGGVGNPSITSAVVVDNDHHMMEMWGPDPTGKNYKMMEITYTRKK